MSKPWFVYVLVSEAAGRTYVGASVDPEERLRAHNGDVTGGAKATRGFRPWKLGRIVGPMSQGEALREEARLKKRRGEDRLDG